MEKAKSILEHNASDPNAQNVLFYGDQAIRAHNTGNMKSFDTNMRFVIAYSI